MSTPLFDHLRSHCQRLRLHRLEAELPTVQIAAARVSRRGVPDPSPGHQQPSRGERLQGSRSRKPPGLEAQIRTRLAGALHSAERAVTVATEKQHLSAIEVGERLARVEMLRDELAGVTR